jgi:hypothetical protein
MQPLLETRSVPKFRELEDYVNEPNCRKKKAARK